MWITLYIIFLSLLVLFCFVYLRATGKESYKTTYMYELSVVAQFKNEAHILKEWLDHYLSEGVQHFYLINDGSTDNFLEVLKPYLDDGRVTLQESLGRQKQIDNYNYYYLTVCKKSSRWVLVCDLDEFMYSQDDGTIADYLRSLPTHVGQIYVPWKIFGSNGISTQPEHVVPHFYRRNNYNRDEGLQGISFIDGYKRSPCKCIVRTSVLAKFWIHYAILKTKSTEICSDNSEIFPSTTFPTSKAFQRIDESVLQNSKLHLNHYILQSRDWFERIKTTRHSAIQPVNVRTMDYFDRFDEHSNEQEDYGLFEKKKKLNIYKK